MYVLISNRHVFKFWIYVKLNKKNFLMIYDPGLQHFRNTSINRLLLVLVCLAVLVNGKNDLPMRASHMSKLIPFHNYVNAIDIFWFSYPGRANFSYISLQNLANGLHEKQKVGSARRVTRLAGSPFCDGRVTLLAGPTFPHINTFGSPSWVNSVKVRQSVHDQNWNRQVFFAGCRLRVKFNYNWETARLRVVGFCSWNPPRAELISSTLALRNARKTLGKERDCSQSRKLLALKKKHTCTSGRLTVTVTWHCLRSLSKMASTQAMGEYIPMILSLQWIIGFEKNIWNIIWNSCWIWCLPLWVPNWKQSELELTYSVG